MKKLLILIILLMSAICSYAQGTHKKAIAKADTTIKPYTPDPKAVYPLSVTGDQCLTLLQSASLGLDAYLMKTAIPANQLENARKYYTQVLQQLYGQYRQKYVADSIAAVKPKPQSKQP